jgi:hypothetical protein
MGLRGRLWRQRSPHLPKHPQTAIFKVGLQPTYEDLK